MKKLLATMLALVMALTLCATAWAEWAVTWTTDESNNASITVTTAEQLKAVADDLRGRTAENSFAAVTITIDTDLLDFTGVTGWTSFRLAGYQGVKTDGNFTIIGKETGTTIKSLNGMLISYVSNGISVVCKNLTIEGATASVGAPASEDETAGCAVFVGIASDSGALSFENCVAKDCKVTSDDKAGGFVGYANCHVDMANKTVSFKNCKVVGCEITGASSTGGLMGHGMGTDGMEIKVENTSVVGNKKIESTGGASKVGALFGTVSSGDCCNGKTTVSATVSGNEVKSGTTEVTSIYGRGYTSTLTVTGGSYDNPPLKYETGDGAMSVCVPNDTPEATVTDGDNTTYNFGADYIREAAKNAAAGQTVTVTKGNVELTNIPAGVTVVVKETAIATVNGVTVPQGNDGLTVYAVTFDSDGGTDVAAQNVAAGGKATQPDDPTKNGYVFEHWCLSTDDTHAAYNFDTLVTSDITLKAHWTAQSSGGTHHIYRPQPTTDTTPKAESPKTFDAGVAVYGLMAVSSVLGMGVVGKKKF